MRADAGVVGSILKAVRWRLLCVNACLLACLLSVLAAGIGRSSAGVDPLAGARFYVDPAGAAVIEQRELSGAGRSEEARVVGRMAEQPSGIWITGTGASGPLLLGRVLRAAAAARRVPVLVIYDIPNRDCGGASRGGAPGAASYRALIDSLSATLGHARAVVIIEPDALAEAACLPPAQRRERLSLLRFAASELDRDPRAAIYVDAGHPGWLSAPAAAGLLDRVLRGLRGGFSLNVSNFYRTTSDLAYGNAISRLAGDRHFVVDTSRNGGRVSPGAWCNPRGARLGAPPTTHTGDLLDDANLWVKPPGESDGACNGGPPAGTFWLQYALTLIAHG